MARPPAHGSGAAYGEKSANQVARKNPKVGGGTRSIICAIELIDWARRLSSPRDLARKRASRPPDKTFLLMTASHAEDDIALSRHPLIAPGTRRDFCFHWPKRNMPVTGNKGDWTKPLRGRCPEPRQFHNSAAFVSFERAEPQVDVLSEAFRSSISEVIESQPTRWDPRATRASAQSEEAKSKATSELAPRLVASEHDPLPSAEIQQLRDSRLQLRPRSPLELPPGWPSRANRVLEEMTAPPTHDS